MSKTFKDTASSDKRKLLKRRAMQALDAMLVQHMMCELDDDESNAQNECRAIAALNERCA